MSLALEIVVINQKVPYIPLLLVSKRLYAYHTHSMEYNLVRMFFSLKPVECVATRKLKAIYKRIDSTIPYVPLKKTCVIGRVNKEGGDNDVCVLGKVRDVVEYFLGLARVGIGFHTLEVYPRNAFLSKGRKQYINKGYGVVVPLGCVNVCRFDL